MTNRASGTKRTATLALFTAIIFVLQLVGTFVKIGAFPVSLVLIPIVVGGAILGVKAGAILGAAFGIFVSLTCVLGWDPTGYILFSAGPLQTVFVCILKGVLAGMASAGVYQLFGGKKPLLAMAAAAAVAPVVNTGVFCLGMWLFFRDILLEWAGGAQLVYFMVAGIAGVNFLIEFALNLILSHTAARIVKIGKRG